MHFRQKQLRVSPGIIQTLLIRPERDLLAPLVEKS